MGVIVMSVGTPRSTRDNIGCTWEHLGVPTTSLGAAMASLGAPATSLRAPRITLEQCGPNNIFFGNAAGAPGNHSYYLLFNGF